MPPPTDRCVGGIMMSGCPSASACFHACVLPGVGLVSTISYKPVHRSSPDFAGDVVEGTGELIRF